MNGRLSDTLSQILTQQAMNEKRNADFYAVLANNMGVLGFTNSSKFFTDQHTEETEHFSKIWEYLMDRNAIATLQEIEAVDKTFKDLYQSFSAALTLEYGTTSEWNDIYNMAMSEKDWITRTLCEEFMLIQKAEEDEFQTIIDQLNLIGGNQALLLLWDQNFKK